MHFPPLHKKNHRNQFGTISRGSVLSIFLLLLSGSLFSQINTTASNNASLLVQSIMGKGYTVTNPVLTCPTGASGTFVSTTSNIGLGQGIVLTTGSINNVNGPNDNPSAATENGGAGDAQLDGLSAGKTMDACALEFDLVPSCDELNINYVFASEEYPQFVGSTYNDIFAFFISGPGITGTVNIATIPNTNTPVTINNVNGNTNSQYYVNNDNGKTVQYNGFTKPLTASIKVIPCSSYHLKMAIADVGDESYDSGVFIEAGSINCIAPEIASPPVCANEASISLCAPAGYTYDWPAGQPGAVPPLNQQCLTVNGPKAGDVYTVNLTPSGGGCPSISKITLKGSDFVVKDTFVCAGAPDLPLKATPLTTGNYEFKWEPATNLSCSNCPDPVFNPLSTQTYTITMSDKDVSNCNRVKTLTVTVGTSFSITATDAEICEGETATLTASGADSYVWQPGNLTGSTINVSPTSTTTYTITGTKANATCPGKPVTTATVAVGQKVNVTVKDLTLCMGTPAQLNGTITGGTTKGTWAGGTGTFSPDRNTINAIYTPSASEINAGTVTLTLESEDPPGPCVMNSKPLVITIVPAPIADAGADQVICSGNTVKLNGAIGGSATVGLWKGGQGTFAPDITDPKAVYTPTKAEEMAKKISLIYTTSDPSTTCPRVSDTMVVTIDPKPIVSAGDSIAICEGMPIQLNGFVGGGADEGTWSGGSGTYTKNNKDLKAVYQPTPAEIAAGKVTFILTSNTTGVCPAATAQITHTIHSNPVVNYSVDHPKACAPHCVNFYDSTTAGNTPIVKWEWDFGNGKKSSSKNPVQVCYEQAGTYNITLKATSDKNCSSTLVNEKMIEVYRNPLAQFTADPNPASVFDPTIHFYDHSTTEIESWFWDFGDGAFSSPDKMNPTHVYPKGYTGSYEVKLVVMNINGCKDSTHMPVEIKPYYAFFAPNAFTPDGNGVNDTFLTSGVGIDQFQLWIFDRWGNLIFESADIKTGWDGTVKNSSETSLQDVFVWKAKIKDIFGKTHNYTGTVNIVK